MSIETILVILKQSIAKTIAVDPDYVPLRAAPHANMENNDLDLDEHMDEFFFKERKVMLLLGDSGAGKSVYAQFLMARLWKSYVAAPSDKPLPLFISLPRLKDPINNAIEEVLAKYGLTAEHIAQLKQNQKFIFILDAYDEIRKDNNLWVTNKLGEWNAKIIITCRTQYIYTLEYYQDYFMPYENERRVPWQFTEVYLKPFNQDQIEKYLQLYVAHHEVEWNDWKTYLKNIDEIPGLNKLIKTPFLLKLAVEAMPEVIKLFSEDHASDAKENNAASAVTGAAAAAAATTEVARVNTPSENNADQTAAISSKQKTLKMTQAKLYDVFVTQWFSRQEQKLKAAQQIKPGEDLKPQFWAYAKGLAKELFTRNITQVIYEPKEDLFGDPSDSSEPSSASLNAFEKYFDERDPQTRLLRSATLLQQIAPNHYAFLHSSLIEYFVTRDFYETAELNPSVINTAKLELKNITTTVTTWLDKELKKTFNQRLIVKERGMLRFNADRVDDDQNYKKYMYELIDASKQSPTIQIAAANALTVLVVSDTNLLNSNFTNIRVPNADLSGAMLWGSDFSGADLTGANFQGTNLRQVNLSNAILSNIHLGQFPILKCSAVVRACVYSQDGRYLAVATGNSINLYAAKTRQLLRTLQGHAAEVTSLAFSWLGDVLLLASGSGDESIRLWNVASGLEYRQLQGHTGTVTSVAFSLVENNLTLASGSLDNTVRLWDVNLAKEIRQLNGHTDGVRSIAFSGRGDLLATSGDDATIRLWNVVSGAEVRQLRGHTEQVMSVCFSPNANLLASGSGDNSIRLWDLESGTESRQLLGHSNLVTCVTFSPQGDMLASASWDQIVRLWDVSTGTELRLLPGHTKFVTTVAFSLQEGTTTLAAGGWDNSLRLWDISGGTECRQQDGHSNWVETIAFSPQGNLVVTGSLDKSVRLWDATNGRAIRQLLGHTDQISSVALSPRGNLIASGSRDKLVCIWEVAKGVLYRQLPGHKYDVKGVAFSPQGDLVASGSVDKIIRLWDVVSGSELRQLQGHKNVVNSVAFSSQGNLLASGSVDKTIRLWDVSTGSELRQLLGHTEVVTSVAFSPQGDLLASASEDKSIRLWLVATGTEFRQLRFHTSKITSVAYSPDGRFVASSSEDGRVCVWQVSSGICCLTLPFSAIVPVVVWGPQADRLQLVVGFSNAVAYFSIHEIGQTVEARLEWITIKGQRLDLYKTNFAGAVGLNKEQWELMKQSEAIGEPGKIVEIEDEDATIDAITTNAKTGIPTEMKSATTTATKTEIGTVTKNQTDIENRSELKGITETAIITENKHSQAPVVLSSAPNSFVANIGSNTSSMNAANNSPLPTADIEMTASAIGTLTGASASDADATTNANTTAAETPSNSGCCALL